LPGQFDLLELQWARQDSERGFLARQFSVALQFLEWALEKSSSFVDPPSALRRATNRLWQYNRLLVDLPGLLPATRLASSPAALRPGQIIKRLSESRVVSDDLRFFARRLTKSDLAGNYERFAPVIMQEEIFADIEYRSFVFGSKTVTIALPRPSAAQSIDIHESTQNQPSHAFIVEFADLSQLWTKVGQSLDLTSFAVDFIRVHQSIMILEVNPLFGWSFAPIECQHQIVAAAVDFANHWRPSTQGTR